MISHLAAISCVKKNNNKKKSGSPELTEWVKYCEEQERQQWMLWKDTGSDYPGVERDGGKKKEGMFCSLINGKRLVHLTAAPLQGEFFHKEPHS